MLALLRANPDAFIKGNINLVKAGAVLRIPDGSKLSEYSAREARAIVHEQIGQWREMRKDAEQPAAVAAQDAHGDAGAHRSEERPVGKECVRTCEALGSAEHERKNEDLENNK